jgi:hypothetical protein
MPAEAIHLSALQDTLAQGCADARSRVARPELREAARAGAIFVDLPYFENFSRALVTYLLKRPQRPSRWGDIFHNRTPIAVGRALADASIPLSRQSATRAAGEYLAALALGYISHAAIDTAMHPKINAMARERSRRVGRTPSEQHHEVEKFQSILFHEQRFGFDFMGTSTLREHITVDLRPFSQPGPVASAVAAALTRCHGEAPGLSSFGNWTGGYRTYVRILASPLGKAVAPPAAKERARPELFDGVNFPARFAEALAQSKRWVEVMSRYLQDGVCDDSAQAAFAREIPEGSIDPDPEAAAAPAASAQGPAR